MWASISETRATSMIRHLGLEESLVLGHTVIPFVKPPVYRGNDIIPSSQFSQSPVDGFYPPDHIFVRHYDSRRIPWSEHFPSIILLPWFISKESFVSSIESLRRIIDWKIFWSAIVLSNRARRASSFCKSSSHNFTISSRLKYKNYVIFLEILSFL